MVELCQTVWIKRIVIPLTLFLLPTTAFPFPEKHYQGAWCRELGGQADVVLPDQTRADCVTSSNAIEVDFGKK
ncbi:MAG: hypothetical protein A2520_06105 [Deltaproteobacteria bacterium RIFOXYD12_FULL_53_23]|nr:MAG: hypothetical protein A2520_06105 [Deltaproteobacteria bacterium RIFOXYD12_FULL_53_23]